MTVHRARRTKIVATLGPASSDEATIRALFETGVDVFRLNFSHGTQADQRARLDTVRRIEQAVNRPIGVLIDLQGPKLRIGTFEGGRVALQEGSDFRLQLGSMTGSSSGVQLPHREIFAALRPGDHVLIDDGKVRLRVVTVDHEHAATVVEVGGVISDRKGVNVPNRVLDIPALSEKDLSDLNYALDMEVDWVALSFVQTPDDVRKAKAIINGRAAVMAKIERPMVLNSLEEIVDLCDGIMVARGDLGVELPPESLPAIQKRIVRLTREAGKPVIVATQMLESMIAAPIPTRAEVSDVATAVYEGADAVMLSAESASGKYPREAVGMMDRIIRAAESDPMQVVMLEAMRRTQTGADAIGAAIRTVSEVLPLSAAIAYTKLGSAALRLSHERPRCAIMGLTPSRRVARRLALAWGVHAVHAEDATNVEDMVQKAVRAAHAEGFIEPGKPIAIVAGVPFGQSGTTNLMRIVWPEQMSTVPD
ncbi:MAG: pyruvate kinase [Rhodospirillaceae bacterium]